MKIPYTEDQIIKAINRFYRFKYFGLCNSFSNYISVPDLLKKLGGKQKLDYFWSQPILFPISREEKSKHNKARNQRVMMLAFLLTWTNDPDFEV